MKVKEDQGRILLEYSDGRTVVVDKKGYGWDGMCLFERQWPHRQFTITEPEHVAVFTAMFL